MAYTVHYPGASGDGVAKVDTTIVDSMWHWALVRVVGALWDGEISLLK